MGNVKSEISGFGGCRRNAERRFGVGADYRYFRVETEDDALDAHKALIIVGTDF